MAKNFYAIKRGFDKESNKEVCDIIESEWSKVKPFVVDYDNARYKGFDTEEEAKVWLSVVDRTDAEKRAKKEINEIKKDLNITSKLIDTKDNIISIDMSEVKKALNGGYDKYQIFYDVSRQLLNYLEEACK